MLWGQCIIQLNVAIIIQKHQEVYGNIIEMNQMAIKQILNHSYPELK